MKKKSHMGLLFKEMGAFKITMILSIIVASIGAYVTLRAYGYIYNAAEEVLVHIDDVQNVNTEYLIDLGKHILFCVTGAYGLYGLALLFSHITAFNTAARLKRKLLRHIGSLPLGYFDTHPSGVLRKLVEKNTDSAETLIAHQIPNTAQSMALPVFFAVYMFRSNALMAVACIIPVIIGFILLMGIMMGGGSDFVRKYQKASADMSAACVEYVRGIPVMKTFGQTADSFNRYKDAVSSFADFVYKFAMSMMNADSSYNTAINSIFVTLVPVALYMFRTNSDSKSVILDFIFFASMIPVAVTILKRIMSNSSESIIVDEAMEALEKVFDEKSQDYSGTLAPKGFDISIKDLTFRYSEDTPVVIDNVSLEIPEKSTVAFVGMSGSGKSTIANLIARFWDIDCGSIKIGGCELKEISKKNLDELMSVVFQESTLLKTSLAKNVALYKPDATKDEILRALHLAQCDDILVRLPDGIDTVYGAKGTYFSGGEIQRIAIARAILKDAPIVILDEATAFADAENEYLIRKALEELLADKTVIMIAHRMQTVRNADMICVIDDGKIVEAGDHERLIEMNGYYKKMTDEYERAVNWKFARKEAVNA
ncbi:MAG: ABC transporter ATP-binding protein [Butyrivibrio sp.]|uniref:ABC transporter ATP-binding protein n=1 Tax=Butyrivibrio sp. TaxID=28121 RepID=UPI001ECDD4D1|nr:ABC transporter ATP-binding protein [Butyrivibrio sp.]MBE5841876.1 ABC transporter ATP-binding protein [Butyrivibrio sp.]